VILAVSLALIALLVETSGHGDDGRPLRAQTAAKTGTRVTSTTTTPVRSGAPTTSPTTTTTTSLAAASLVGKTPVLGTRTDGNASALSTTTTSTTSPPAPTATTTPAAPVALPAERSETEGYFDPPSNTSGVYDVSGTGPTDVSVLWSAPVYLTMTLSCPGGSQMVGGTTAMDASVPEGTGCSATVSEPSSESTSLTYTVAFGPANG
jgi:hypothetical protein